MHTLSVCLFVCLCICLLVCVFVCLFVCLLVCLFVYLIAWGLDVGMYGDSDLQFLHPFPVGDQLMLIVRVDKMRLLLLQSRNEAHYCMVIFVLNLFDSKRPEAEEQHIAEIQNNRVIQTKHICHIYPFLAPY